MTVDDLEDAVGRIRAWGEARSWRGYDPYDALNSPYARVLTLGRPLGRRLLTQAVKLSPLNLRPVLGIRPEYNAKALALVASAYARLAATGDGSARKETARWLDELERLSAPDRNAWGYHFPVQTRVFAYAARTPNAIATTFAAHAYLDAAELLGDAHAGEVALGAARFMRDELLTDGDRPFFRYLPGEAELVHNANALACGVLARTARVTGADELLPVVDAALPTTLEAQRPDGSWPYAEGAEHAWVDNFHTGYVLDALAECTRSRPALSEPLERGVAYWERALFESDGTPRYTPERRWPLDAHCYATAVDTYVALAHHEDRAREAAMRAARVLIEQMLEPDGHVTFQRHRGWTNRVPLIRWTTAPSFRALAGALSVAP